MQKPIEKYRKALERKRRKESIKAQNAKRKAEREPVKPLTDEQQAACAKVAQGLIELFFSFQPKRDEFPSELEVKEVDQ